MTESKTRVGSFVKGNGDVTKDPTPNVQNIVKAAVDRLDDIRVSETRRLEQALSYEILRIDQLRLAEGKRIDEQMELRAHYENLLQVAEAKRIDAIHYADVNAVAVANERVTAQATVLANQVTLSADTLRTLVATTASAAAATASTVASQLQQVLQTLNDRLVVVERANYEGKGEKSYSDPLLSRLTAAIESLQQTRSTGEGRAAQVVTGTANNQWVIGLLIGIPALLLAIVGIARIIGAMP